MTSEFELMPCEPEAVLPTQVSGGARWDADMSGPRALMLAVLEDAVQCIEEGRWQRRFRTRRLAAEAQAWVWCDRADWPFSFVNICEVLGFDVDAMRAREGHGVGGSEGDAGGRNEMSLKSRDVVEWRRLVTRHHRGLHP